MPLYTSFPTPGGPRNAHQQFLGCIEATKGTHAFFGQLATRQFEYWLVVAKDPREERELSRRTDYSSPWPSAITDTNANDNHKLTRSVVALVNHLFPKAVDSPLISEATCVERANLRQFTSLRLILCTVLSRWGYTKEQTSRLTMRRERSRNSSLA
ncbi:hypothetical protein BDP81DRAFT_14290 [Colletotrichum phormii]|uniref:Uncharacterized protein n=1 Tax=Colletotrichum phormii TaxID=359342 RepID=A0AAJ0ELY5_9PEZI|nr:uncharacterized protein BDP81DRAFT_14290 [Colletotrichum phormii]KAK1656042.1 hypothetical protein BDP81DRAFT_14290 [Colletotrichum phormii]